MRLDGTNLAGQRMTATPAGSSCWTYSYDASGEVTVTGVRPAAGPNGEDVVTEVSGSGDAAPALQDFTYDLDGNMTSDGVRTYTWTRLHASLVSGITPWQDGENRLVAVETSVTAPGAVRVEFVYDFQGRRRFGKVHAWAGDHWALAATRIFSYDGWNCIHEGTTDHNQVPAAVTETAWLWGLDLSGSMQGAGGVGGLLQASQNVGGGVPTAIFYVYDGSRPRPGWGDGLSKGAQRATEGSSESEGRTATSGNVTALVDAADGSVVARYDYSPFGMTVLADGSAAAVNPWRFSTKYHDTETALVYYGYRYYSPELGRWINRDPIGEHGGTGIFVFCRNIPSLLVDFLGLAAPEPDKAKSFVHEHPEVAFKFWEALCGSHFVLEGTFADTSQHRSYDASTGTDGEYYNEHGGWFARDTDNKYETTLGHGSPGTELDLAFDVGPQPPNAEFFFHTHPLTYYYLKDAFTARKQGDGGRPSARDEQSSRDLAMSQFVITSKKSFYIYYDVDTGDLTKKRLGDTGKLLGLPKDRRCWCKNGLPTKTFDEYKQLSGGTE